MDRVIAHAGKLPREYSNCRPCDAASFGEHHDRNLSNRLYFFDPSVFRFPNDSRLTVGEVDRVSGGIRLHSPAPAGPSFSATMAAVYNPICAALMTWL
jgi:hypothetical protein